jgi:hypothetical protein
MTRHTLARAARHRPGGAWVRAAACIVAAASVGLGASATITSAQDANNSARPAGSPQLLVRADSGRVTVGDPVTLRILLRLTAGEQLAGATPEFREPLPDGVRLLRVDSLRPEAGGEEAGALVVALFRPGTLRLPPIAVAYRAGRGAPADTAITGPVAVTVSPVVPGGSGTLRDIRNIETAPVSLRAAGTAVAAALAVIFAMLLASRFQRRRRMERLSASRLALANAPPGPFDAAIARLAVIANDWAARRDIESHYAETADVLRRYLADAHGVPALERTTPELLGALPHRLSVQPARDAAGDLLGDADLVKFARYAPASPAPAVVLATARSILTGWDAAGSSPAAGEPDGNGDASGTRDPEAGG